MVIDLFHIADFLFVIFCIYLHYILIFTVNHMLIFTIKRIFLIFMFLLEQLQAKIAVDIWLLIRSEFLAELISLELTFLNMYSHQV